MKGKLTQYVENHGYGGLTHLSSKIGISKEQLRLIIAGKTKNPSVYTVAKIAEVLECSIEELIGKKSNFEVLEENRKAALSFADG